MKWPVWLTSLAATLITGPVAAEGTPPMPETAPVQVMVLAVFHFDNPGLDVVNTQVDDMLAPRRQREIEVLVDTLAQWTPTKVAVESVGPLPSLEMAAYAHADELMKTSRNETVQLGYRMGRKLGHDAVYGYDERPTDGEPDYFPMGKVQAFAQANDQAELLEQLFAEVQAMATEEEAKLPQQTLAEALLTHNDTGRVSAMHDRVYYSMLKIGNGDNQPGAELNAYWYMRNAKMFAKIDMIAEPGDRILVIAGSGHATWLKHFARRMPGYELVEALPFVEEAAEASKVAQ